MAALAIGAVAGVLCFARVQLQASSATTTRSTSFGVHGVGGTWGAIATGLFATKAVNSVVANEAAGLG